MFEWGAGILGQPSSEPSNSGIYSDPMEAQELDSNVALLQLSSAPDDPPVSSPEYQRELFDLLHLLRAKGIVVSGSYADGGGFSGGFVVRAASLGPVFDKLISEWIKGRYGRRAQLRIGDSEVEAQTADEVVTLFRRTRESQKIRH